MVLPRRPNWKGENILDPVIGGGRPRVFQSIVGLRRVEPCCSAAFIALFCFCLALSARPRCRSSFFGCPRFFDKRRREQNLERRKCPLGGFWVSGADGVADRANITGFHVPNVSMARSVTAERAMRCDAMRCDTLAREITAECNMTADGRSCHSRKRRRRRRVRRQWRASDACAT